MEKQIKRNVSFNGYFIKFITEIAEFQFFAENAEFDTIKMEKTEFFNFGHRIGLF